MASCMDQREGAARRCCATLLPLQTSSYATSGCCGACAGAVTFSLIQAVEQGQASTYNVLLRAMRYSLKNGPQHFPKVPELSASHDFDLNRPFLL